MFAKNWQNKFKVKAKDMEKYLINITDTSVKRKRENPANETLQIQSSLLATRFALFMIFLLITGIVGPGIAYSQSRTVHVGVYQNKPKVFTNEKGQPSGIFIDLLDAMAMKEGWKLIYVQCEWEDCLQRLTDGKIDLMPDVAFSQGRAAKYDFHETQVLQAWSEVYAIQGMSIHKISQLEGKRIAVLKGSIQQTVFEQMMNGFGYKVTIIQANSLEQAFDYALKGLADGVISNYFYGDYYYQKYKLVKTSIVFNPSSLYFTTAKGKNHDLLDAIDRHLNRWLQEPKSTYYKVLGSWGAPEPAYRVPQYLFWIISSITGLLLISAGIVFLLRKQVRSRTEKLEQSNAELYESEQRYQTLARISPVGIFRTDKNGVITYTNPTWCKITGLSGDDAMDNRWFNAVHPEDKQKLSKNWEDSILNHKASFSDYRFVHADGKIIWVMGQSVVPEVNSRNEVIGYVGTISDITKRVHSEIELRKLNAELEQRVSKRTEELKDALQRAQEADRLKSAFLATMSHELRTPLNSIIGFTGIILQGLVGEINEEQRKQLNMVRDSAHHLLALINDVLDISKIEAGQLELRSEVFVLQEAIDKSVQTVRTMAEKKSLPVLLNTVSSSLQVYSDRRRVEQVLINLLNNAIKFTDNGSITLSVSKSADNSMLRISICDTGIGIKAEEMKQLFEPFKQIDTGTTRRYEGTGLGLSICRKLACMLEGSIEVQSEGPDKGSTFTFTLPSERKYNG